MWSLNFGLLHVVSLLSGRRQTLSVWRRNHAFAEISHFQSGHCELRDIDSDVSKVCSPAKSGCSFQHRCVPTLVLWARDMWQQLLLPSVVYLGYWIRFTSIARAGRPLLQGY